MIISQNIIPNVTTNRVASCKSQSFTSRSFALKMADDVMRRVIREFPTVYSSTRMNRFSVLDKTRDYVYYQNFINRLVSKYHEHYIEAEGITSQLEREITGMKKLKTGNCAELADATNIALRLNGYKDVKILNLFAYNKQTKRMRDLDHSIVGIDFKLPDKYEHCRYINYSSNIDPKHRIYPQNDSIIVDSWAGFTEYGKNATERYNCRRDLIKGQLLHPPYVKEGETLLKEGEELCFVPVYEEGYIKPETLPSYGKEYYSLILPKNRGKIDLTNGKNLKQFNGLSQGDIDDIKISYGLKSAKNKAERQKEVEDSINSIKAKYGIIKSDKKDKNGLLSSLISILGKAFSKGQ